MSSSEIISEAWNAVRDYIANRDRSSAAEQFVLNLTQAGVSERLFSKLADIDPDIQAALESIIDVEYDDEEDDEE